MIVSPAVLAFASTGDGVAGLPFGWTIDGLQNSVLIYLGLSSLAFVIVWLVGFLRRS
ncbi:cytochrome B6 [Synechococcus sp. ATX 2A4]|uniref:cytochrome B6 n=1 Tax=Synechococcus sp. ATX 2A4 TaxID=2823727 RepID=UPI0021BCF181|nr:cytochrome B6 [Synechococcus sp. ATX 2A4]